MSNQGTKQASNWVVRVLMNRYAVRREESSIGHHTLLRRRPPLNSSIRPSGVRILYDFANAHKPGEEVRPLLLK